jgi:hypothetical protein
MAHEKSTDGAVLFGAMAQAPCLVRVIRYGFERNEGLP